MHVKDDDFHNYASFHSISDFADLSISEIIALEFLVRYSEPVVRHTLYTEIKQLLEFKENSPYKSEDMEYSEVEQIFYEHINKDKSLSTSSFYNSLKNLGNIGLLKLIKNKNGKNPLIEATKFTQYIPKLLLKFLINNNIMDSDKFRADFSKQFFEILEQQKLKNILSIWLSEYEVLSLVQQLLEYADKVYVVSKTPSQSQKLTPKIKNISYKEMMNQQISTPNDVFDAVIVPVYKKNIKFYDMEREQFLKEISRVCKPKGLVILVAVKDLPLIENNVIMNDLVQMYNLALNNRIFSEEELKEDMEKISLSEIEIINFQGLLFGVGRNL